MVNDHYLADGFVFVCLFVCLFVCVVFCLFFLLLLFSLFHFLILALSYDGYEIAINYPVLILHKHFDV